MPTTLQKETQKRSVIFTRENTDCVYFDTQMLPRVAHTFTENVACVSLYQGVFNIENYDHNTQCHSLYKFQHKIYS